MNRIHERYINEANRIRSKYFSTIDKISIYEKDIEKYKNDIEEEVKKCEKYMSTNKNADLEHIKKGLTDNLMEIDVKINRIVGLIQPLFDEVDKLKKSSKDLFISIKDKYPELSEEEIQKEIIYSLKK